MKRTVLLACVATWLLLMTAWAPIDDLLLFLLPLLCPVCFEC